MSPWFRKLQQFAAREGRTQGLDLESIPGELVDLFFLAKQIPSNVLDLFATVTPAELKSASSDAQQLILLGRPVLKLPPAVLDKFLIAKAVGTYLHALDAVLDEHRDRGPVRDINSAYRVTTSYNDAFLVPRTRRPSTSSLSSGPFRFRAVERHRIIETSVESYDVFLHASEVTLPVQNSNTIVGAGFFKDLKLDIKETSQHFWIEGVNTDDLDEKVKSHIENAHRDNCAIAMFPELTVPESALPAIQALLRRRPWLSPESTNHTIALLVAGSCHLNRGDELENVATIFDGYGTKVAEHVKLRPYIDEDGRVEKIRGGSQISVLVAEDALIAFGICKDFSERGTPNPFVELDVDFFVVTSLANKQTMAGHLATAKDVRIRYRASSIVVQQIYNPPDTNIGYILHPASGQDPQLDQILTKDEWNRRPALS